ncbi:MAG: hypothetical protein E6556_20075 [Pantoea sp.]|nr:hypothetical protein [Pantoea sp.]
MSVGFSSFSRFASMLQIQTASGNTAMNEVKVNVHKEAVYRFGVNAGANFYINQTTW